MPFALSFRRLLLGALVALPLGVAALASGGEPAGRYMTMRPIAALAGGNGYWVAGVDGTVAAFGDVVAHGSLDRAPNKPIVGMASTASGKGYWLVASDGGMFAFGDAGFYGSMGGKHLNKPVVGMASTASGRGYWLVASDGGMFAFGDAGFYGSMGGKHLNKPVVGMASTASGRGYWLVASDGGMFSYGDASFHGSMGGRLLNQPVVAMGASPSGNGYSLIARDGGVFAFGDAAFYGSTGSLTLAKPIVGAAVATTGKGYWFVGGDGGVFAFGQPGFLGSATGKVGRGAAAMAASPRYVVNTLPVAVADSVTTAEDRAVTIDVLANDQGLVDGGLTVGIASSPARGATGVSGTRITYSPNADVSGTDSFRYRVTDVDGDSSFATVTVSVTAVNDPPALGTFGSAGVDPAIDEDTTHVVDFSVRDSDHGTDSLSFSYTSSNPAIVPADSTGVTLTGSGSSRTLTLHPAANGSGTTTFTVKATDGAGATGQQSINLTVRPVNDPPVISAISSKTTQEDTQLGPVSFTVADVDDPVAGLVVTKASDNTDLVPVAGIALSGTGQARTVAVTPALNQSGLARITIRATDSSGASDSEGFNLDVTPVNDAPTISAIADATVDEDSVAGPYDFAIADVDSPLVDLTVSGASNNPVLVPDANITFGGSGASHTVSVTPPANLSGTAIVTVSASDGAASGVETFVLNVTAVNDVVEAVDDTTSTAEDTAQTVAVLANDTGLGDGGIVIVITSGPGATAGSAVVNSDNTITYTPTANFDGVASIGYRVTDLDGDTDTATLGIDVTPVNDTPTITAIADATVDEDSVAGPYDFTIGDVDDFILTGGLSLTGESSDQALVADGDIAFFGLLDARQVRVTPRPDAFGTVTITVTVSDGEAIGQATFELAFTPVADPPTADDQGITTGEDTARTGSLVGGDVDAGESITFEIVAGPSDGTLSVFDATTGAFTYSPDANFFGADSFTFRTKDSAVPQQFSGIATVDITVTAVNDVPTITDISDQTTDEDTSTGTLSLTIGDVETPAGLLLVAGTSDNPGLVDPSTGYAFSGTGASRQVTITPKPNANGTATVTITVTDANGGQASDTFTLTVNPVNDAPVAVADAAVAVVNGPTVTIAVRANDTDPDNTPDQLTVSNPTGATRGTVTCTAGACLYTPTLGLFLPGTDTFSYTITDPDGLDHTAIVTVVVGL